MKKTEEIFLINKERNRVKRFRKFENISNIENDFIEIEYGCVVKVLVSPFIREAELNQQKMPERNIKNSSQKVGRKQIYLKIIFKYKLKTNLK